MICQPFDFETFRTTRGTHQVVTGPVGARSPRPKLTSFEVTKDNQQQKQFCKLIRTYRGT